MLATGVVMPEINGRQAANPFGRETLSKKPNEVRSGSAG